MSEDSGSASSRRTSTSTVIYSQESFLTYAPKATKLLDQLFPNSGEIVVERLTGGGFNRIVGATLASSGKRIVLRIPRFDTIYPEIADQAAVLQYLESLKTIPVPRVLHFDITDQNPLGASYMIQNRVDGQTLQDRMANLTQEQRLEITKEVAKVTAQMCSTAFKYVGTLCAPSPSIDKSQAVEVGFANLEHSPVREPFSNTLDFLVESFNSHILDAQSRDPKGTFLPSYHSKLKEAARALNTKRPFANKFCLLHNDFMARNILVKENADGQLRITATLDWDFATSAPIEAVHVLPHWLWTWSPEEEEGIAEMANETPTTAELRAVKDLFEKEIERLVPQFMLMWRDGFLARELFYFAVRGFSSTEDFGRANRLLEMAAAL